MKTKEKPKFSNPRLFETPDHDSNQESFPSFTILSSIFWSNFHFMEVRKIEISL